MRHGKRRGPSRLSNLWRVGLIVVGLLSLAVIPHQAFASDEVVSANGVNCVDPGEPVHRRIQRAVRAILDRGGEGDIEICPGRYFGPVTVNDPDAEIDFIGVGNKSDIVIRARSGSAGPIFRILRADHIGIRNVTVDGRSRMVPDAPGGVVEGIFFGRTNATVEDTMVQNIDSRDGDAQGICIHMQGGSADSWEFEISDNIISNCTRVGILADGDDVEAEVHDNIIIGPLGPHTSAPNGIQFSHGAEGEIKDNLIDAVESLVPTIGAGSGIIMFCAGETEIEDNIITGTDIGATVADSEDITVISNDMLGNIISVLVQTIGFFYGDPGCPGGSHPPADNEFSFNNLLESINTGIDVNTLDPGVGVPKDNEFEENVIESQGFFGILVRQGEDNSFDENIVADDSFPDILDQTTGGGTSGTANFYDDNVCNNGSIPAGLCDPIFAFTSLAAGGVSTTSPIAGSPFQAR